MNDKISGLLRQKGDSPVPQVGAHIRLKWEQKTGKSGRPWIKVNNAKQDEGQLCQINGINKTDQAPDSYGNVSYNIEFTPIYGAFAEAKAQMQGAPPNNEYPPDHVQVVDGVQDARRHLMKAANLYNLCVNCINNAVAPYVPQVGQTSEMFQAAVGTLFIEASRAGYVDKMPDKPFGQSAPQPPQPQDDDEPPF